MIFIDSKINFDMHFPGIPIIFLHAFPLNHQMWQPQMEFLRAQNIGYIAPDLPGFGKSPLLRAILNMEIYTEDLMLLIKQLHIKKAVFIGLSMGGYIAFSLFRKSPDIFAGLVLANTRAAADDEPGRLRRLSMIHNLSETKDPRPIYEQHLIKFFTSKTGEENRDLIEFTHRLMGESTLAGIVSAQQAMASRSDAFDLLPLMSFPVLLIAGSRDELTTVEDAKRMAENLPDSELKIIDEAAHLSNLEKPELFNSFLSEYLEKLNVTRPDR